MGDASIFCVQIVWLIHRADKGLLMIRKFIVFIYLLILSPIAYATTIDFDSLTPGSVVSTIDDVTFSSSVTPNFALNLVVSSNFDTSSGRNYLGVGDGGFEVFFPGDTIDLVFANPVTDLSVNFISTPSTPGNIFTITTLLGSSSSGAAPDGILSDLGEVFTVSFASLTPFTSAQLYGGDSGLHTFNIDDISYSVVPVPPAFLLFASGVALLLGMNRRRNHRLTNR